MNVNVVEKRGVKYVEGIAGQRMIQNERDVVELLGLCGENDTDRLLLHAENLTDNLMCFLTEMRQMNGS